MEIPQQVASGARAKLEPNVYPNNTLIADLSQWHQKLAHLWPLGSRKCWPSAASKNAQQVVAASKRELAESELAKNNKKLTFHIPEPLLRTRAQLSSIDYDRALSSLTADVRYQLHLLLYRRCQAAWLLLTTIGCLLWPPLLAVGLDSWPVLVGGPLAWLCLQLVGLLATGRFRRKLDEMLEKSVAQANSFFLDHKLMLGVINAGGLFAGQLATKLAVPLLYFDTCQCREHIESMIGADLRPGSRCGRRLDYSKLDLCVQPTCTSSVARSQLARKIILRYSQRWISQFDRQKLLFTDDQVRPRHLSTGKCLCQFVEEQFCSSDAAQLAAEPPARACRAGSPLKAALTPTSSEPKPACARIEMAEGVAGLGFESEPVGRSDELLGKLRLLLELRQLELAGLDGSLFAVVHQKPTEATRPPDGNKFLQRRDLFAPERSHILELC